MNRDASNRGSEARSLALYAAYVLLAVAILIYILAFFAGNTGIAVNGGAINEERNSITIS